MGFSSRFLSDAYDESRLSASGRPLSKNWLAIIAFIWAGQAVSMFTSYASQAMRQALLPCGTSPKLRAVLFCFP